MEKILANLINELRRGTQILFVLNALKEEKYGYALLSDLELIGVAIEAGTLYPLLRRLEEQGLLSSKWNTEDSRPRKYYIINDNGLNVLNVLKEEWQLINNEIMVNINKGEKNE